MTSNKIECRRFDFGVKALFRLSKMLPIDLLPIKICEYVIEPVPNPTLGSSNPAWIYLISYAEFMKDGEYPDPQGEMSAFAAFFSVALGCEAALIGLMVNGCDVPLCPQRLYAQPDRIENDVLQEAAASFSQSCSLSEKCAEGFFRACELFGAAARFLNEDRNLCCLLAVASVECIASVLQAKRGALQDRFIEFLMFYSPENCRGMSDDRLRGALGQLYGRYRSRYVHQGIKIPVASLAADRSGLPQVIHCTDGNDALAPGLVWFMQLVRSSLLNVLREQVASQTLTGKKRPLRQYCLNRGIMRMRWQSPQPQSGDGPENGPPQ
jgi:hypothetical protein